MNFLIGLILAAAIAVGFPPRSSTDELAAAQIEPCGDNVMIFWEVYSSDGQTVSRHEFYLPDETLIVVAQAESGTYVVYTLQPDGTVKRYSTSEAASEAEGGPCRTAERIVKSRKSI